MTYQLPPALAALVRKANASGMLADDIPKAAAEVHSRQVGAASDLDRLADGFEALADDEPEGDSK